MSSHLSVLTIGGRSPSRLDSFKESGNPPSSFLFPGRRQCSDMPRRQMLAVSGSSPSLLSVGSSLSPMSAIDEPDVDYSGFSFPGRRRSCDSKSPVSPRQRAAWDSMEMAPTTEGRKTRCTRGRGLARAAQCPGPLTAFALDLSSGVVWQRGLGPTDGTPGSARPVLTDSCFVVLICGCLLKDGRGVAMALFLGYLVRS